MRKSKATEPIAKIPKFRGIVLPGLNILFLMDLKWSPESSFLVKVKLQLEHCTVTFFENTNRGIQKICMFLRIPYDEKSLFPQPGHWIS